MTGERVGRFEVSGSLGSGGMGDVLLVSDPRLRRELAAKRLQAPDQEQARQRFELEAQILGFLEHPGIVPIHELGEDADGTPYYTMKRVDGVTLDAWLEDPPARIELLDTFIKVCDAVGFAHAHRVAHRDLKPANIMIGAFGEVLVMDWGLAKLLDGADETRDGRGAGASLDSPALTQDGAILGTPGYIPPEVVRGDAETDAIAADVYALGAILYQLLTLRRPFAGTGREQLAATLRGQFVPPGEVEGAKVPWELDAVVMKAMARRPAERYATVGELKADLLDFLAGRTMRAPAYRPYQKLGKWLRRHRARIGLSLLYATLMATLLGVAFQAAYRQRQFRAHERGALRAAEEGDWATAQSLASKALGIDRDDERLKALLAQADGELARQAAALARSRRLADLQARLAPTARLMADTRPFFYIPKVDFEGRLTVIREALDALSSERARFEALPEYWAQLGLGWGFVGEHARARVALSRAVALGSEDPWVPYHLGRLALLDVLVGGVADDWTVEERRAHLSAATARFRRAEALWEGQSHALLRRFTRGLAAYVDGDLRSARPIAMAGLKDFAGRLGHERFHVLRALTALWDPADSQMLEPRNWASETARALQDGARANSDRLVRKHLGAAIAFKPHDWNLRLLRGSALRRMGKPREAIVDLRAAQAMNPALVLTGYHLARCHLALGKRDEALGALDAAIAKRPDEGLLRALRARLRLLAGDAAGARTDLSAARKAGAAGRRYDLIGGYLALAEGRVAEARAVAARLVTEELQRPLLADAHLLRARAHFEERPKDAQWSYNQAIKRGCVDLANAMLERAIVNIRLGHVEFGWRQVLEARRAGARADECDFWEGVASWKKGWHARAMQLFDGLVKRLPKAERAAMMRRIEEWTKR